MELRELLATPLLEAGSLVSPGDGAARVRALHVGESAAEISGAPRDSVFVLTRAGAGAVRSFRLDVLMARAAHAGVRLVVLPAPPGRLPRPHEDLAGAVAVVAVGPEQPLGEVLVELTRRLAGGDSGIVGRLREASAALAGASSEGDLLAVLRAAGVRAELTGAAVVVPAGVLAAPADEGRQWVASAADLPPEVLGLLLHAATGRLLAEQGRANAPDLATLLGELLSGDAAGAQELRPRAQALGFRPDGWHQALAVEVSSAEADPRLEETVRRVALRRLHEEGAAWSWTHRASSLVFVRTWTRAPGEAQLAAAAEAAGAALAAVRETLPASIVVHAGRGPAAHAQVEGLRRAVSEARSAARHARSRPVRSGVATFDEFGLEQALVDWYLSDGAAAVGARLAPLTSLPPRRGEPLLRTLRVYLDHQCSVAETAQVLFLHRNAVRYRIDQVKALLGTDLSDPDERLGLLLACRGRVPAGEFRAGEDPGGARWGPVAPPG